MTFEEYSSLPNKLWWQITDQGYWNAGFEAGAASQAMAIAAKDAEITELVEALEDNWNCNPCETTRQQKAFDAAQSILAKVRKP